MEDGPTRTHTLHPIGSGADTTHEAHCHRRSTGSGETFAPAAKPDFLQFVCKKESNSGAQAASLPPSQSSSATLPEHMSLSLLCVAVATERSPRIPAAGPRVLAAATEETSLVARTQTFLTAARRRAAGLPSPSLAEAEAFLVDCKGDISEAGVKYRQKLSWRARQGRVGIGGVGGFYLSEGYSVPLEGCADREGRPIIYANGMPHGSVAEVVQQTIYTYERTMAQALKTKGQRLECTTICNVLNPTFRFPDRSIKASLAVAKAYYPWHARGKTIFVGLPPPVRWTFKLCRPFMSKQQYESIGFADVGSASLLQQISADNLPAALGGTAKWSVESYVSRRCAAEGVRAPQPRAYKGKRLDVEELRGLERR